MGGNTAVGAPKTGISNTATGGEANLNDMIENRRE